MAAGPAPVGEPRQFAVGPTAKVGVPTGMRRAASAS